MEDLNAARDKCLGPDELITRNKAVKSGGVYQGGVAFERNSRACPVKRNTRCYTVGNSYEGPTKIMAPNKNAKVKDFDSVDESLEMRRDLLMVSQTMPCGVLN
jgi:hypothetical protein